MKWERVKWRKNVLPVLYPTAALFVPLIGAILHGESNLIRRIQKWILNAISLSKTMERRGMLDGAVVGRIERDKCWE